MTAAAIRKDVRALRSAEKARVLRTFFKTGPGQYGEGDEFLGIAVPDLRGVARRHRAASIEAITALLASRFHEERLLALLILVEQYDRADAAGRGAIFALYLRQTARVNNWDLVDLSAPNIVGAHLLGRGTRLLDRLARSDDLWERRIAIVATHAFIRAGDFAPTLRAAERLLDDRHDLIHKAVGWMLREVGKRDEAVLTGFLDRHAGRMPRTMLRYAIERLPEPRRRHYMSARKP